MRDNLAPQQRRLTFLGIGLAMFLGALDQTIVATALPRIVADLHGLERYSWVATAYLMASTALIPIYGKLADMTSRRTLEISAIGVFLVGSALCGLAGQFGDLPLLGDGITQLIVFRALQGAGGAGLFALALIVVADLFGPTERGKYQGYLGAVFGISSVLGPLLGGFLTDQGTGLLPGIAGWRLVFYVNLPIGLVALGLISRYMPRLGPLTRPKAFDGLSALLLVGGISLLVVALQGDKLRHSWTSPFTLLLLGGAALALGGFIGRSLHHPNPILAFGLFKNRTFRATNGALFLIGGAFLSVIIFEPLFMVRVLGESATRAGISLMPLSLGVVLGSVLGGQLVTRFGHYRNWLLGGLALFGLGVWLLYTMPSTVSYYQVLAYVAVCGLGVGPTFSLYTLAVQNATDPRFLGQATSSTQFFRQIGGTLGTAILGALLAASLARSLPGKPSQTAGEGLPSLESSVVAQVDQAGVAQAVGHLYGYTLWLVAGAFLITLFIKEVSVPTKTSESVLSPLPVGLDG